MVLLAYIARVILLVVGIVTKAKVMARVRVQVKFISLACIGMPSGKLALAWHGRVTISIRASVVVIPHLKTTVGTLPLFA